ncbi:cysteine desulfurase [Streptococcus sp. DD13]|uniref:cysteine desulfurase n=1 Tax=Streptococcus sp. DD13 TaxID=1777881 RepID=UPI000794C157|nr:cysteine desulfurase [Streptococcus sp. DD13]KXT77605.1 Cysteine desulfurase, SufS subfamily [Streptococcus sp. DD13]
MPKLDVYKVKKDFAILDQRVNDEPLVYLDNAATTQKPKYVLEAVQSYYETDNANVHRGVHTLAERATASYEAAREKVTQFIHAKSSKEILFTRGATTGLNWVAKFAEQLLQAGDEVLITVMEHHSNIIPWQQACQKTGAKLVYAYLKDGQLDLEDFQQKVTSKTKFASVAHVSNVLGCQNPVKELAKLVHEVGAYMIVDAAQSAPYLPLDVQDLDCDFLTFSGHKMLAPTGVGVLYGKEEVLQLMDPVEFGGEMIDFVYEQSANWKELPWKFEAGTPNIAGAIGLGAAVDYLSQLGMENVWRHEQDLVAYVLPKLQEIEGLTVYGPQDVSRHAGVIAFNVDGIHPHDLATALDYEGVAVRAGHHCAQPLMRYLKISSAARASFSIYNSKEDCDRLVQAILAAKEYFNGTL